VLVMSDHEVESLVEGSSGWPLEAMVSFCFSFFHDIPHSCLEYGTGVIG